MKKTIIAAILFVAVQLSAQSVAVTVYNDNLGVVREVRKIKLNKGISKFYVSDVPSAIDPTSVHLKFDGEIIEQNYKYDLANKNSILRKYIDKEITLADSKGKEFSGKLVSLGGDDLVLSRSGGGLIMIAGLKNYKIIVSELPEGFVTKPTLEYLAKSNREGYENVELSYFTGGMNWHAEYVAVLDENDEEMKLNSWVSIENNSGATFKNAKVKLVAGEVHRAGNAEPPYPVYAMAKGMNDEAQIEERQFFEYHIYELKKPTTLANKESKQIAFFDAEKITVTKKYVFRCSDYNGSTKKSVNVQLAFENSKENGLGIPLPEGKVRLFKKDGASLEFIGEDKLTHVSEGETVGLSLGKAFDVKGACKELSRKKIAKNVFEIKNRITIFNAKDSSVKVDAIKILYGDWEVIDSNGKYDKQDSRTLKFTVEVPPHGEKSVEFTVRIKG